MQSLMKGFSNHAFVQILLPQPPRAGRTGTTAYSMATESLLCLRCSEDAMLGDFGQVGMAAVSCPMRKCVYEM